MRQIVDNNVRCVNPNERLNLIIYYKSQTVTSLLTKNNQSPPLDDLQKTNLVYELNCKNGDCEHHGTSYTGVTQTTLSRRLTVHKAQGAPRDHLFHQHNLHITRDALVNNTKIILTENDTNRLLISEALMIQNKNVTDTFR